MEILNPAEGPNAKAEDEVVVTLLEPPLRVVETASRRIEIDPDS
jgi:hypothetical protein